MARKIVQHIAVGLSIGFIVTTACMWCFGAYEASGMVVMRNFTAWLIASVLYGLVSLIYDTSIPLPISIAIHFTLCGIITFAASVAAGLLSIMELGEWCIRVLPVFVGIYIIISLSVALDTRFRAKKINEKIKEKQPK